MEPKFFVSYRRRDARATAARICDALRARLGANRVFRDEDNLPPGAEFRRDILDVILESQYFLALISEAWIEDGIGKGRLAEPDDLVRVEIEQALGSNLLIVPVLIDGTRMPRPEELPESIRALCARNAAEVRSGVSFHDDVNRLLDGVGVSAAAPGVPSPDRLIETSNLPGVTPEWFVGRVDAVRRLHEAWVAAAEGHSVKPNVVVLQGEGGLGKTALVHRFLDDLADRGWPNAEFVYAWSADTQGRTDGDGGPDPEELFDEALALLGDPPTPSTPALQKAKRLRRHLRQRQSLLVLDGLEPLQPLGTRARDRLQHTPLRALIRELAHYNPRGLLIITSRLPIPDLAVASDRVLHIRLDELSVDDGVTLLTAHGVVGPRSELERAVQEYRGHALTLTWLASFLVAFEDGAIARRSVVSLAGSASIPSSDAGERAEWVVASYLRRFQQMAEETRGRQGHVELVLLRLLGLFDRPAEPDALLALRDTRIAGLTDDLVGLEPAELGQRWRYAKGRLRELHLALPGEANDSPTDALDLHPMMRVALGSPLRSVPAHSVRQAHDILYRHYLERARAAGEQPTLAGMRPHSAAMFHGARAGKAEDAFTEVYWKLIQRRDARYASQALGAAAFCLSCLTHMFDPSPDAWSRPRLAAEGALFVRLHNELAFALRGVGRLRESSRVFDRAEVLSVERKDLGAAWRAASLAASNHLILGELAEANVRVQRALDLTTGLMPPSRIQPLAVLAEVLLWQGKLDAADEAAHQGQRIADTLENNAGSMLDRVVLELHLAAGQPDRALKRAKENEGRVRPHDILGQAFTRRAMGLARAAQGNINSARHDLTRAVGLFRDAGRVEYLPLGLISRAHVLRRSAEIGPVVRGDLDTARGDLDEAEEIARGGDMGLWLAHLHVERAWLARAAGELSPAHVQLADEWVARIGCRLLEPAVRGLDAVFRS